MGIKAYRRERGGGQPKDPDLLIKDHRLTTSKDNGGQFITGTIKNISQYRYLAVKVNFALLDASCQVIPDDDATTYRPIPPVEGVR